MIIKTSSGKGNFQYLLLLFGVLLLSIAYFSLPAVAATTATLSMEPSATEAGVGEIIRVDVVAAGYANLYGTQVQLIYNPAVLQAVTAAGQPATKMTNGNIFSGSFYPAVNRIDTQAGRADFWITFLGKHSGRTGSGTLLTIFFKVLAPGETSLTFSNVILANNKAEVIPVSLTGLVINPGKTGQEEDNKEQEEQEKQPPSTGSGTTGGPPAAGDAAGNSAGQGAGSTGTTQGGSQEEGALTTGPAPGNGSVSSGDAGIGSGTAGGPSAAGDAAGNSAGQGTGSTGTTQGGSQEEGALTTGPAPGTGQTNQVTQPEEIELFSGSLYTAETVTTPTGTRRTLVTISSQEAAGAVAQAIAGRQERVAVTIAPADRPSTGTPAELEISIPAAVLARAGENKLALELNTGFGSLVLPREQVAALGTGAAGLKIELARVTAVGETGRLIALAGEAIPGGRTLAEPTRVKTNFSGRTQVTLSFTGVDVPAGTPARQQFLSSLAVFVLHSDGDRQVLTGESRYNLKDNTLTVSVWVDKFSDFILVERLGEAEEPVQKVIELAIGLQEAVVNKETKVLDAAPFIKAGANRTMVPVRFVSEILGAGVDWLEETRQVWIREQDKEIMLTIDSEGVLVDGRESKLDSPAEIVGSRTFVPLRFVSESLGATVDWDGANNLITITR